MVILPEVNGLFGWARNLPSRNARFVMHRTLPLLVALAVFTSTLSRGQQKLSLSAPVSPTLSRIYYSYRFFYPESDGQVVEPVYVNGVRWAGGYSAGASLLYTYAPGWSVSAGIWYQQLSIRQARQATAGEGTVTLSSRVVRLPLLLNYAPSRQRLSPCFTLGFFIDFPTSSRVVVTRGADPTQNLRLTTTSTPIFHGLLGAGLQYKLTDRYTLMAQPVWSYKLGQFGDALTYNKSFELSLQTQVTYSF